MLDIKKYMYFESKSRFRFFLLTLIDNQSNENHPYTYQGLISIGKRSSFYDLYICIQSKYTLNLSQTCLYLGFFNTLQYGCYNHYFILFLENTQKLVFRFPFEEIKLMF